MNDLSGGVKLPIEVTEIMAMLPHRYPFLLIDRVIEFEPNKRVLAIKNVTVNEPCFTGHFPGHPVMPGVLILEALAQTCALLAYKSKDAISADHGAGLRHPDPALERLRAQGEPALLFGARRQGTVHPHRGAGRPVETRSDAEAPDPPHGSL